MSANARIPGSLFFRGGGSRQTDATGILTLAMWVRLRVGRCGIGGDSCPCVLSLLYRVTNNIISCPGFLRLLILASILFCIELDFIGWKSW